MRAAVVDTEHGRLTRGRSSAAIRWAAEMTLQDLGNIGEFVAAVATLATLVYLAIQIRQNTGTVRAGTYHASSTAWSELCVKLAADPSLAEIYHLGRVSPDSLSKEDMRRFELAFDAMLAQIENFYLQYAEGHLSESNQNRFAEILGLQFRTPGVKRYWVQRRGLYTMEFVRYVEDELGLPPSEAAAQQGAAAAEPRRDPVDLR
jgi:hypothetical protein